MTNLAKLEKVLAPYGVGNITVNPSRCLNNRFKQVQCNICVSQCPMWAISFNWEDRDHLVELDPLLCANCGYCLHACPTGVFDHPQRSQSIIDLVKELAGANQQAVEIVCGRNPQIGETDAPVAGILPLESCLASLSLSQLVDLTRRQDADIWLDDRFCSRCALGIGQAQQQEDGSTAFVSGLHPHIKSLAAQANALLAAYDVAGRVRVHSEATQLAETMQEKPIITLAAADVSRRDFFSSLGSVITQATATAVAEQISEHSAKQHNPVEARLAQALPPERVRLQSVLTKLPPPTVDFITQAGLPFADVVVSDSCTACGNCARFCPTGALRFATGQADGEDGQPDVPTLFALGFIAADCVDCNICVLACSDKALTLKHEIPGAEIQHRQTRILIQGELVPCEKCGTLTRKMENGPSLCFICREKEQRWGGTGAQLDHLGFQDDILHR